MGAFNGLKTVLINDPCLKLPDLDDEYEVIIDASEDEVIIGAVLTQHGHPIAFESKKLNSHQWNYPIHDKKMCAIMRVLDPWRSFLLERHFKVYIDHHSLVYLKTQPNLNQRQFRWMEWVADYDCEILYKSGKETVVLDAFSRIHISTFSFLSSNSIWKSFITRYRKDPFKSLIKEMEEKKGIFIRHTIEDKLLYYRTDEYEPWRLYILNTPYRNIVIHDNHDLSMVDHSSFIQIYNKITRFYYWLIDLFILPSRADAACASLVIRIYFLPLFPVLF